MKGQYFSFDAVIGATIFILTMMALLSYWYGISSSFEQTQNDLAREAFRISEMMFTPTDKGLALGWRDMHYDHAEIMDRCSMSETPREFFPSSYNLTIVFYHVPGEIVGTPSHLPGGVPEELCTWGPGGYEDTDDTYVFRRVFSIQDDDGTTELGYADLYFYLSE